MPIRANDRVLIVGSTGSGKTVLALALFSAMRPRRLLIDPKGEHHLPGVRRCSRVSRLDLEARAAHFVPARGDDAEWEELFERVWAGRRLPRVIHIDEAFGPTRAGKAPAGLRLMIQQGRALRQGIIACTQRPVNIESTLRTEADHVICFDITAIDRRHLAADMGLEPDQLERELAEVHARYGRHGHLWWDRAHRRLTRCPPVPLAS